MPITEDMLAKLDPQSKQKAIQIIQELQARGVDPNGTAGVGLISPQAPLPTSGILPNQNMKALGLINAAGGSFLAGMNGRMSPEDRLRNAQADYYQGKGLAEPNGSGDLQKILNEGILKQKLDQIDPMKQADYQNKLSIEKDRQIKMDKEAEIQGRSPQLNKAANYLRSSIAKGADVSKLEEMVKPERFDTTEEQKTIGTAEEKGLGIVQRKNASKEQITGRQDMQHERTYNHVIDKTNALVASRGSALGMATNANVRANRALAVLQQPMITPSEMGSVQADFAAIFQGGSPTDLGMHEQKYNTLYSKWADLKQYVTANPTNAMSPEIKTRLLGLASELKQLDNEIIDTNANMMRQAYKSTLLQNPKYRRDFDDFVNEMKASSLYAKGVNSTNEQSGNIPSFNSEQEAEASGHKGEAIIAGRRARID